MCRRSTGSGFDFSWFISVSSECLCIFGLRGAIHCIYIYLFFLLKSLFTFWYAESGPNGLAPRAHGSPWNGRHVSW